MLVRLPASPARRRCTDSVKGLSRAFAISPSKHNSPRSAVNCHRYVFRRDSLVGSASAGAGPAPQVSGTTYPEGVLHSPKQLMKHSLDGRVGEFLADAFVGTAAELCEGVTADRFVLGNDCETVGVEGVGIGPPVVRSHRCVHVGRDLALARDEAPADLLGESTGNCAASPVIRSAKIGFGRVR